MRPLSALVISDRPDVPGFDPGPYRYQLANHISVLRAHPGFQWLGIIAPAPDLLDKAAGEWGALVHGATLEEIPPGTDIDVAVILASPEKRPEIVQQLAGLKWIIADPPLGLGVADSESFNHLCRTNGIGLLVNGAWRIDANVQALANGAYRDKIGDLIGGGGVFGRGLWHTGLMWVDVLQAITGEIETVRALSDARAAESPVVPGDQYASFAVTVSGQKLIAGHPVTGSIDAPLHLDLWGTQGRLSLAFLGDRSRLRITPVDGPTAVTDSDYADALLGLYDNLDGAAANGAGLAWNGDAATEGERIIETVLNSADQGGEVFWFR